MDPERLRRRILDWYRAGARDLPWRRPPGSRAPVDPYRVWLSEVMLQQTTVVHATPYFHAFLARWPTVTALADAEDAEVMAAWAGLGYYARARNLLACARAVRDRHGGVFPDTEAALLGLPGVGPYTAAAVAAIAFNRPANVVDGNVERVMSRLFAVETPLPAARPELRALAAGLADTEAPADWAQALMDLGATVCRPRSPACGQCPAPGDCAAFASGDPGTWPRKSPRAARPAREETALVIRHAAHVLVEQRRAGEWWEGLWDFPRLPASGLAGLRPGPPHEIGRIRYTVTHHRITLSVVVRRAARRTTMAPPRAWVSVADLAGLALSSPGRKIARMLAADGTAPPRQRSRYGPAPGTTSSSAREKKRA